MVVEVEVVAVVVVAVGGSRRRSMAVEDIIPEVWMRGVPAWRRGGLARRSWSTSRDCELDGLWESVGVLG